MPVKNGTPNYAAATLCDSCRNCTTVRGHAIGEVYRHCFALPKNFANVVVTECSAYQDKKTPYLNEMYQMAYILELATPKEYGFASGKGTWRRATQEEVHSPTVPRY